KRFSVQANRSEVLFVDYIAEHLSVHGRAGVIVPEGIIFQSANAYKALRKMLVEGGYLYAVVSLPAGVFNPYSGVKTSILLMDKSLAKKTKDILFVKVENDGFDLGAQRRAIDKNDLPQALEILCSFCHSIKSGNPDWTTNQVGGDNLAHLVTKEKIAKNGEYNLSGDRYKEVVRFVNQKWLMVEIGEICDIFNDSTPLRSNMEYWENGNIP
ncbi:N-6 DNA methylase, partial [bacterium]|nr:N-6 DNA methylase [bacterium]